MRAVLTKSLPPAILTMMKIKFQTFLILVLTASTLTTIALTGCKSPPDRIAYNTIGSIDATATKAYDGLADEAIQFKVSSNDLRTASVVYDDLHKSLYLAAVTASEGTNSIAPANLLSNSLAFAQLVLTIEQKK